MNVMPPRNIADITGELPRCEKCGNVLPSLHEIYFDDISHVVARRGYDNFAPLTPSEFEVFKLVLRARGKYVSSNRIFSFMYDHKSDCDIPQNMSNTVRVTLNHAKNKLRRIDVEIVGRWGLGYRIIDLKQEKPNVAANS